MKKFYLLGLLACIALGANAAAKGGQGNNIFYIKTFAIYPGDKDVPLTFWLTNADTLNTMQAHFWVDNTQLTFVEDEPGKLDYSECDRLSHKNATGKRTYTTAVSTSHNAVADSGMVAKGYDICRIIWSNMSDNITFLPGEGEITIIYLDAAEGFTGTQFITDEATQMTDPKNNYNYLGGSAKQQEFHSTYIYEAKDLDFLCSGKAEANTTYFVYSALTKVMDVTAGDFSIYSDNNGNYIKLQGVDFDFIDNYGVHGIMGEDVVNASLTPGHNLENVYAIVDSVVEGFTGAGSIAKAEYRVGADSLVVKANEPAVLEGAWNGTSLRGWAGNNGSGSQNVDIDLTYYPGDVQLEKGKTYSMEGFFELNESWDDWNNGTSANAPRRAKGAGFQNIKAFYPVYIENLETTAVDEQSLGDKAVSSVKYYNAAGVELGEEAQGVNIVVTTYDDGTRTISKVVK